MKVHVDSIWKFLLGMKVELAFFCYFAPGTLNSIGLELLPIEKVIFFQMAILFLNYFILGMQNKSKLLERSMQ